MPGAPCFGQRGESPFEQFRSFFGGIAVQRFGPQSK